MVFALRFRTCVHFRRQARWCTWHAFRGKACCMVFDRSEREWRGFQASGEVITKESVNERIWKVVKILVPTGCPIHILIFLTLSEWGPKSTVTLTIPYPRTSQKPWRPLVQNPSF